MSAREGRGRGLRLRGRRDGYPCHRDGHLDAFRFLLPTEREQNALVWVARLYTTRVLHRESNSRSDTRRSSPRIPGDGTLYCLASPDSRMCRVVVARRNRLSFRTFPRTRDGLGDRARGSRACSPVSCKTRGLWVCGRPCWLGEVSRLGEGARLVLVGGWGWRWEEGVW